MHGVAGKRNRPDCDAQIQSQIFAQQQEIERQAVEIEQLKAFLAQETRTTRRRHTPRLRSYIGEQLVDDGDVRAKTFCYR